jgi:hypothetical protein
LSKRYKRRFAEAVEEDEEVEEDLDLDSGVRTGLATRTAIGSISICWLKRFRRGWLGWLGWAGWLGWKRFERRSTLWIALTYWLYDRLKRELLDLLSFCLSDCWRL